MSTYRASTVHIITELQLFKITIQDRYENLRFQLNITNTIIS